MLIVRRAKLYYTVSGIITPIGGRPVHRLREDAENFSSIIIKISASSWLILINKYIEMYGQQNIKKREDSICARDGHL